MADIRDSADEIVYAQSDQADATLAGDRMVIYHRGTGNAITLNPAGSLLWKRLEQTASADALRQALQEKWAGLSEEVAQADVENFLAQLMSQQLCVAVGAD